MASLNYNEITNSAELESPANMVKDPMFHWDTHYPGRVSCLRGEDSPVGRRKGRRRRDRNSSRYKTQPITFDEIKEMDEEPAENKDSLKTQFTVFSRSMDGLGKDSGGKQGAMSDSTNRSAGDSSDDCAGTSAAFTSRKHFHQRRKKNMHNSIEEIPEREKSDRK